MIGRRKNPQNLWLLLVVPLVGAVGWAARRWLWRNKATQPASKNPLQEMDTDQSGKETIISPNEARSPVNASASAYVKATDHSSMDQRAEAVAREAVAREAVAREAVAREAVARKPAQEAGHALRNKPDKWVTLFILLIPFLILPVAIVLLAFNHIPVQSAPVVANGNVQQGQVMLESWGCGSCHTIPGVRGATGQVGPVLKNLSDRSYIAGHLQNTPDNMVLWIMHPQQVSPGVDMPESNVPEGVARDMAAYLYSLH